MTDSPNSPSNPMSAPGTTAHQTAETSAARPLELPGATGETAFRHMLDLLPDGVCVLDHEWRITFVNRCAQDMMGTEDVLGATFWQRFPFARQEPGHTACRTAMQERVPSVFEAFDAASQRWLRVQVKPNDQDGLIGLIGLIVLVSDVTARKQAEHQAAEMTGELTQAMDAVSEGILSVNRDWVMTFANVSALRLLDPAVHGMIGANLWEHFPAAAVSGIFWENYHRTMDEGIPTTFEAYYPDPLDLWFSVQTRRTPAGMVIFFRDTTEQRRRELVVAAQQELLTRVQQAARVATWELNTRTGELLYGPGSHDLLAGDGAQVRHLDALTQALLPGHKERLLQVIAEALDGTGTAVVTEFALRTRTGAVVWVEARGQAVHGSTIRLRGMSSDITWRKLDEEALSASTERYRLLADLNPQALWAGDAQGNIVYANQGFLAYLGVTQEGLREEGWLQSFAPVDRKRVIAAWLHAIRTGEDYNVEAMLREAATGEYRYWTLRARPLHDAAGKVLQWLGIGTDIHEAKTYAASLRAEQVEAEQRRTELEGVYTTSPVGLALFDPQEFRFLNLNDLEAEIIGLPREKILGRRLDEIVPSEGMPALMGLMQQAAAGHPVRDFLIEGELAARPGEKRVWNVNYTPVFDSAGKVRAISTASIEVTNQKKAEAALIQSEKLAAVGRLASSISHEINNPLEAITNLLYLIAHDPVLPQELKIYVHMAQAELTRVSQIATQTLRFHRQAVNRTQVTPADLMNAVVQLYTGRLANSNIIVDARYATQTKILCFENDIRQVLNNLIANALDAMRHGGRLVIRAHASHLRLHGENVAGVRLLVADTGHGMTPAIVARIFEPFYTTKDLNGTGLGLWISLGIVERHQGRLHVRSAVGKGSVFSLFLPCAEAPAP